MPKTIPCKWDVREKSRNVHEFRLRDTLKSGSEAWGLWMADEHFDHPKCDLDLLKQHHDEAAERGAFIVKVGDVYCAMQGQGDKRGDKGSLRPEHQGSNYLDLLVSTGADWYEPYKDYIGLIGLGNHETAIYKHHETCLIERLCEQLRYRGGIARKGGYTGFVRVMMSRNGTGRDSYVVYYNHGSGGGGQVTKGVSEFSRISEYVVADAYVTGHMHWKTFVPRRRVSINNSSNMVIDSIHDIRCGTYKDEYEDGHAGFHVEKGRGPRPLGGWWSRFYVKNDKIHVEWKEAA
jgi:hypothetical protein